MGKVVKRTWGESKMTAERKRELLELAKRPDREIDFSEIPPLTGKFWAEAVKNPFYRPVKKQVTLRIDADVLAWLRSKASAGYQTRANAVLRKAMLTDLKQRKSA